MASTYRHTQVGVVTVISILAALAVITWIGFRGGWSPLLFFALATTFGVGILFSSLTVEIGEDAVDCRFGPGLIRKRIAVQDIRGVEAVRNPWYYGWGIHYTPRGWLYNVSGLDAVELTLASGKVFRVGTDEPAALTAALRKAMG